MARVGEFVRDNASLGEFRRDKDLNIILSCELGRVKASLGPRVGLSCVRSCMVRVTLL